MYEITTAFSDLAIASTLVTLGALVLVGLATDLLGRRTRLPRVTLLILFGFLVGPGVLDLLPSNGTLWFQPVADVTLMMIGFLLGGTLTAANLRAHGRAVITISVSVVAASALVVFLGLWALGVPLLAALLFAGIAPATDPIATRDVVTESEREDGFTATLLGIVAIDDAWGLVLFSVLMSLALAATGASAEGVLLHGLRDLVGAVALGTALGFPMVWLTGRVAPGEPSQWEALAFVLLCGGLALWLAVSHLLAAMVMGAVVANRARHHNRPFHAIEGIEWPFRVLFFVLAGAILDPTSLLEIGAVGAAFVALRILGRFVGGWTGGTLARTDTGTRRWMGPALLPQAGVAIGMALVASQYFPAYTDLLLPVVIGTTVVFEVIGPVVTRLALQRAPLVREEPGGS